MKYYVKQFPMMFKKETLYKLNEKGVLLTKIPYTEDYKYSLEAISEYALKNMEDYMNIECKQRVINQVNWLVENISEDGTWKQYYKLPYYKMEMPWVDGMGQGLAISALIRAYKLTANYDYLDTAKKAFNPFQKKIKDGGNLFIDNKRKTWIEECPSNPAPHILSGFMYALFGVYDLYKIKLHNSAGELWEKGINTLEKNIHRYDLGFWSKHNLIDEYPAEYGFHKIHIEQLKALYKLSEVKKFKEYYKKFEEYENSSFCKQKATVKRGFAHLKKHGLGIPNAYLRKKRWLND